MGSGMMGRPIARRGWLALMAGLVLGVAVLAAPAPAQDGRPDFKSSTLVIESKGAKHRFRVEEAVTPREMAYGLMFRRSLPGDHGMLIVYDPPEQASIWMKNTYLPLDIVFIAPDGKIESIHYGARPHSLTAMTSKGAVGAVLELNAGVARILGIGPGDIVRHPVFKNVEKK